MKESAVTKTRRFINSTALPVWCARVLLVLFVLLTVDHLFPFDRAYFRSPQSYTFAPFALVGLLTFWVAPHLPSARDQKDEETPEQ